MSQTAQDELEILRLVARLAQASDDRDEATYKACLATRISSGTPGLDEVTVSADVYSSASIARLSLTDWTHHKLMNAIINVGEIRASASIDCVVEVARSTQGGQILRTTIGGRYQLEFVRTDGKWLINRRLMHRRYIDGHGPAVDA
ncbi:nuclear transport factor 2 family protein [Phyllobacterium sp. SB3]|uniref:nuclear transport factor 2 family protein n=1 Tax=Phyllobacterium sp. SB3 TaxID=3156073 RepID=UPI0032AF2BA7